jgi:hypothetical protein
MLIRVLSIIGLALTVLFIIWLFVAANSNGRIGMDEFALPAFFYGLVMLGITIFCAVKGWKTNR